MNQYVTILRQILRFALFCTACVGAFSITAHAQVWTPYTTLDAYVATGSVGPVFDSLGNAWVATNDNVNFSIVEYEASSGTWQAPHVLGPWIYDGSSYPTAAIVADQSGDVYVIYNSSQGGAGTLTWAKYTPASGWSAPAVIYNSTYSFGEVMAAFDSAGHLVVVFVSELGIWNVVYDVAKSSWGEVETLASPSGSEELLVPSMAANTSGTRLALVYLSYDNQGRNSGYSLEYSFFDSSRAQWDKFAPIPNSKEATAGSYSGVDNYYPIAVDSSGNVTLATALYVGHLEWQVGGFRYENGAWQMTVLTPVLNSEPAVDTFGSIAQSPSGTVLIAAPYYNGVNTVMGAFLYTPGVGWDTETAAVQSGTGVTRNGVAWYQSDEAVVVYDNTGGEGVALYSNGAWSSGPAIPNGYATGLPGIGTAPNGNVLFIMSSAFLDFSYGLVATWLEP
jgi:hypothetical protein